MNPHDKQPVSLADELRKFAEDLRSYKPMRSTAINETQHTIANKILALLDQHAAEQPKLTADIRECLRLALEWNDDYMRLNNLHGKVEWCEWARKLLTSPVAPPPHPLVPLDGGNWYYDAQRDIVMIDGRKYEPAVEEFRIPSVMAAIQPPVAPGEQPLDFSMPSGHGAWCASIGDADAKCDCFLSRSPFEQQLKEFKEERKITTKLPVPPAQERASDEPTTFEKWWNENFGSPHLSANQLFGLGPMRSATEDAFLLGLKEGEADAATAAKLAREEVLAAVIAACDSEGYIHRSEIAGVKI